jgi:hypothetical protein
MCLQITDMNGKALVSHLITSDDTRVNVAKLSKGIYIEKISGGSSIYTQSCWFNSVFK